MTTAVAKTVGKGIIDTGLATEKTVLAALIGAIVWNLITWWLGLPSSSSHALIGGLVGAALVQSGTKGVQWHGVAHKVVIPAAVSPAVGFAGAFVLLVVIYCAFFRAHRLASRNRGFRLGQLVSRDLGRVHARRERRAEDDGRDRARALRRSGTISHFYIPTWVKISAGLAIAAGTYVGGWRIIRTLGQRIYKMRARARLRARS